MHILPTVQEPPPLPARFSDLPRVTKRKLSLTDEVEALLTDFFDKSADFRRLCASTKNKDAVEANVKVDRERAAALLRDFADKEGKSLVGKMQLGGPRGLIRYMNGALHRVGVTPKQRHQNGHSESIAA